MSQTESTQRWLRLLQEAVDSSAEGITLSDASRPDNPIVYANEGFERLTGYTRQDVIGQNCRFLQGPATDQNTVSTIRRAIEHGTACTVELLNHRKDGTPFWNRLSITPLRDASGRVTHFVGIQSDITELKETRDRLEIANQGLEQFQIEITRQMEQARKAQEFLLPPPRVTGDSRVNIVYKYVPTTQIGGDLLDIVRLQDDAYGILVADVTGHGIHAALLSFTASMGFKNIAPEYRSAEATLRAVNETLYGQLHDDNFVAMFYAILDPTTRSLTYTQAGTPPALLVQSRTAEVIPLHTPGTVIGVLSDVHLEERQAQLEPGDKVLLYTDAIVEAINPEGEMLGVAGLQAFLAERGPLPLDALLDGIYAYGQEYSGQAAYDDDFTLVGLQIAG